MVKKKSTIFILNANNKDWMKVSKEEFAAMKDANEFHQGDIVISTSTAKIVDFEEKVFLKKLE